MHSHVHTCMHIRTHAHTHTYIHTHACMQTCMHAHTHACMHTHTHTNMHACMHTRTHACTHTHTQTQTHSEKETNLTKYLLITFWFLNCYYLVWCIVLWLDRNRCHKSLYAGPGIAQSWLKGHRFKSLQEQRENFSSPWSTFCADSYFGIRSTPVLLQ